MCNEKPVIKKPIVNLRYNIETSDTALEVIEVKDKYGESHFIEFETVTSVSKITDESGLVYESGSISCQAHYLFGPLRGKIGELVSDMGGKLDGYCGSVKITNGQIMVRVIEMRGLNVGTFQLNKIVTWAKQFNPKYKVQVVKLSAADAYEDNRDRRNTFYENFGLRFNYKEDNGVQKSSGGSFADLVVADLVAYQHLPGFVTKNRYVVLKDLWHYAERLRSSNATALTAARNLRRERRKKESFRQKIATVINPPIYLVMSLFGFVLGSGLKEFLSWIR